MLNGRETELGITQELIHLSASGKSQRKQTITTQSASRTILTSNHFYSQNGSLNQAGSSLYIASKSFSLLPPQNQTVEETDQLRFLNWNIRELISVSLSKCSVKTEVDRRLRSCYLQSLCFFDLLISSRRKSQ